MFVASFSEKKGPFREKMSFFLKKTFVSYLLEAQIILQSLIPACFNQNRLFSGCLNIKKVHLTENEKTCQNEQICDSGLIA